MLTEFGHVEDEFLLVNVAVVVLVQNFEGVPQVLVHFIRDLVQDPAGQHEVLELGKLHRPVTWGKNRGLCRQHCQIDHPKIHSKGRHISDLKIKKKKKDRRNIWLADSFRWTYEKVSYVLSQNKGYLTLTLF